MLLSKFEWWNVLTEREPPQFVENLSDLQIQEGEQVEFVCKLLPKPFNDGRDQVISVHWQRYHELIKARIDNIRFQYMLNIFNGIRNIEYKIDNGLIVAPILKIYQSKLLLAVRSQRKFPI